MGVVYAAHQSSIARTVAVKMLKPSAKVREEQRDKFISEAVVTGELDHPNIVPIYDLGSNDRGRAVLFDEAASTARPGTRRSHQKRLDENLSILLRVADAVAFAHAGGVIHRDPEAGKRDARRLRRSAGDGLGPRADHARVCACRRRVSGRQPGRHAGLHVAGNGQGARSRPSTRRATSTCWARSCTRSSAASRPIRAAT